MSDMDTESIAFTEGLDNDSVTVISERNAEIDETRKYFLETINKKFPDENYYKIAKEEITKKSNIPLQPILQRVTDNQNYYSQLYLKCIEESTDFIKQLKITMDALLDSCNLKKQEEKVVKKVDNNNIISNNDSNCHVIKQYIEDVFEDFEFSKKEYDDVKKLVDAMKNLLNITKKEV